MAGTAFKLPPDWLTELRTLPVDERNNESKSRKEEFRNTKNWFVYDFFGNEMLTLNPVPKSCMLSEIRRKFTEALEYQPPAY